ncbi:MAG: murein L,D-transpeptidase catalytic domain family protein [Bacteroidota bacterium]
MRLLLKLTAITILLAISVSALAYIFWYKPKFKQNANASSFAFNKKGINENVLSGLKKKADEINTYANEHKYNDQYCFMVDMKIESGNKRFFVYNLQKDSIELSGLVAHGSGKDNSNEIKFSNEPGSLCSSLGKYKIGRSYNGKFGLAYKLYGLDKTNSNATNRFVVLHAHSCVPNEETSPIPICESWGCPTVAPTFLSQLKKYIDRSEKPVLLVIYN